MPSIADAPDRQRALDPRGSFIVQAPAGSGKTELLAQRFLRLLSLVEQPESIVAITFTRKAAAEMRNRILDALRRAGSEPRPEAEHAARTWELARAALERDRTLGWQIEENPARLRISTFDSFCLALARQMPWLSRAGGPPQISDEPDDLYRLAARNTLRGLETRNEWSDSIARLLAHLDNNLPQVEDLVIAMLKRRDQWLQHVYRTPNREELERPFQQAIRKGLAKARNAIPADLHRTLARLAARAASNLSDAGSESRITLCGGLETLPGVEPEDLPVWQGLAELLLTKERSLRKRVDKNSGFPPNDSLKASFKGLLESLETTAPEAAPALDEVRGLPSPRYTGEQWSVLLALFDLLRLATAELRMAFRERRQVDFIEVTLAAIEALGPPDQPTDLAYALDFRLQHLLVDEFQDTSRSQFELLERLTQNWEEKGDRTLFLVGDPMQSIYRFREADVGLFLKTRKEGIGGVRPENLTLRVNFRSRKRIVDWVNETFRLVLPPEEDIAAGAVPYAACDANDSAELGPEIRVHPFAAADAIEEAERVLRIVEEARAGDPQGKIAILLRSRGHAPAIVMKLKEAGQRFVAVEMEPLSARPVVQDLWALTRALLHPADRIAWLAVLRAPWCGLTLADLLELSAQGDTAAAGEMICDEERLGRLSADGRARIERVAPILRAALAERARMPLRLWVESVWLQLGGPACVREAAELEDADAYLTLLEQVSEGGDVADFAALQQGIEELYARPDPEADGSLQILTMHKAKGLEFDTVILPGLGKRPRNEEPRLLNWLEIQDEKRGVLLLAPIKRSGQQEEPIADFLVNFDKRKTDFETGRLLYVATTRAKRELHLLGHVGKKGEPHSASLLRRLWPSVSESFTELEAAAGEEQPAAPAERQPTYLRRLPLEWRAPEPPAQVHPGRETAITAEEIPVTFEWVGDTLRHVGTVVHRYLQVLGSEGALRWDERRLRGERPAMERSLASLGVPPAELAAAAQRVELALLQTLADPRGQWLLARRESTATEFPLSGIHGGKLVSVVLDRTFVDEDGVRWIVDYKTSIHGGGDLEGFLDNEVVRWKGQLERYAELMEALDTRPIRLGLYFPLLQAWKEWRSESGRKTEVSGASPR